MRLSPLIGSMSTFIILYLLHILIVRKTTPRNQDGLLLLLYIVVPLTLYLLSLLVMLLPGPGYIISAPLAHQITLSFILYICIAAAFVASFPAIYADCPTLIIAYIAKKYCPDGVTCEQLVSALDLKENSEERITDAIGDKLIHRSDGRIFLTRFGRIVYYTFRIYRRVVGLKADVI
jgi:hypothetical protein